MIAVENQVAVLPVTVAAIFDATNSADLFRANAAECSVPDAWPVRSIYEAMERAGSLKCFAAFSGSDNLLIGFVSVLSAVVAHDGHLVATTESLFVDPAYRHTSAFEDLFAAAENYATESGCRILSCSARVGSPLDKILSCRPGFQLTHHQHTEWLGEWQARGSGSGSESGGGA